MRVFAHKTPIPLESINNPHMNIKNDKRIYETPSAKVTEVCEENIICQSAAGEDFSWDEDEVINN